MCLSKEDPVPGGCTSHTTALAACSGGGCQWNERELKQTGAWSLLGFVVLILEAFFLLPWLRFLQDTETESCCGGEGGRNATVHLPVCLLFYDQPLGQCSDLSVLSSMYTVF